MKSSYVFSRALVSATLVSLLAACQTIPQQGGTSADNAAGATSTAPAEANQDGAQAQQPGVGQPAPVAVLLADTVQQEGWTAVPVQEGQLFINPQPVITRDDLTGVQAGRGRDGEGLLGLMINPDARLRLKETTSQFPNKRLVLVIGRTMMAAPSYTTAVDTDQLVFPVGSEDNAAAAARAISGKEAPDEVVPAQKQQ